MAANRTTTSAEFQEPLAGLSSSDRTMAPGAT